MVNKCIVIALTHAFGQVCFLGGTITLTVIKRSHKGYLVWELRKHTPTYGFK